MDVHSLFAASSLTHLARTVSRSAHPLKIPPCLIPENPMAITPEMLPLVELKQEEINRIVNHVPGGASNVQEIYQLVPLQEGILFHHLMGENGDPYLLAMQGSFDTRLTEHRCATASAELYARRRIFIHQHGLQPARGPGPAGQWTVIGGLHGRTSVRAPAHAAHSVA